MRKCNWTADSPSNTTFATELHLVTGFVTVTTCSYHVLRLDLYRLEEGRTNLILQQHNQSTSSVQFRNFIDSPQSPVVRYIAETVNSYQTSDFVFEFCHIVVFCCLMMIPIRKRRETAWKRMFCVTYSHRLVMDSSSVAQKYKALVPAHRNKNRAAS